MKQSGLWTEDGVNCFQASFSVCLSSSLHSNLRHERSRFLRLSSNPIESNVERADEGEGGIEGEVMGGGIWG